MDEISPNNQNNQYLNSELRQNSGAFKAEVAGQNPETKMFRERLDDALAKKQVTPELVEAMNKRIEAIEAGNAPIADTKQLAAEIEKIENKMASEKVMTRDILAGSLNGSVDLVGKADAQGAGYDAVEQLIAQTAKKYAQDNKN